MKNQNQTVKVLNLLLTVLAVLTLFTAACAQEWFETDEENLIEYPDPENPDESAEFPPEAPPEMEYFVGSDGEQLGIMPLRDALRATKEAGLDLGAEIGRASCRERV